MVSTLQKMLGAVSLALLALMVTACGKQAVAESSRRAEASAPLAATPAASLAPLTVNHLAVSPSSHLGPVSLVGVVGIVNKQKGFIVIDSREYQDCGLSCLTEAGTRKIPVRWSGLAPQVKDTIRIDGELQKDEKGYVLVASKVTKQ